MFRSNNKQALVPESETTGTVENKVNIPEWVVNTDISLSDFEQEIVPKHLNNDKTYGDLISLFKALQNTQLSMNTIEHMFLIEHQDKYQLIEEKMRTATVVLHNSSVMFENDFSSILPDQCNVFMKSMFANTINLCVKVMLVVFQDTLCNFKLLAAMNSQTFLNGKEDEEYIQHSSVNYNLISRILDGMDKYKVSGCCKITDQLSQKADSLKNALNLILSTVTKQKKINDGAEDRLKRTFSDIRAMRMLRIEKHVYRLTSRGNVPYTTSDCKLSEEYIQGMYQCMSRELSLLCNERKDIKSGKYLVFESYSLIDLDTTAIINVIYDHKPKKIVITDLELQEYALMLSLHCHRFCFRLAADACKQSKTQQCESLINKIKTRYRYIKRYEGIDFSQMYLENVVHVSELTFEKIFTCFSIIKNELLDRSVKCFAKVTKYSKANNISSNIKDSLEHLYQQVSEKKDELQCAVGSRKTIDLLDKRQVLYSEQEIAKIANNLRFLMLNMHQIQLEVESYRRMLEIDSHTLDKDDNFSLISTEMKLTISEIDKLSHMIKTCCRTIGSSLDFYVGFESMIESLWRTSFDLYRIFDIRAKEVLMKCSNIDQCIETFLTESEPMDNLD